MMTGAYATHQRTGHLVLMFMRTTRTLLLALYFFAFARAEAQTVLYTGFETWSSGTPEGMIGPHTDMPLERITEVTTALHSGTRAMGLQLGTYPEAQVTTVGVPVIAGELYSFRFWVRGVGRIRTTVFDGRSENDGYAQFNAAIDLNSPTAYQQVVQQVFATNTTGEAEFVIAVEGSSSNDMVVIDDLYVLESALPTPLPVTIADIQETQAPNGYSPLEFSFVNTQGIVTGIGATDYFIQDGSGPWNGIQVRAAPPEDLAIGDRITVLATVAEAGGLDEFWERTVTQLMDVQLVNVHSSDNALPTAPNITPADATREEWEGVRARIADLECLNLPEPLVGEWTGENWLGMIEVDDLLYATWPTVGQAYSLTGIIHYAGRAQLLPTGAGDIETGVGMAEQYGTVLHAYPVPARDVVFVELPGMSTASYILCNVTGREVLHGRWSSPRLALDVSALPEGPYVLRTINGGEVVNARIVVQH